MRKIIDNGYIVGLSNDADEMTESEVAAIEDAQRNIPPYQDGYIRKLRADTLTWEFVEAPAEDVGQSGYTEGELLAMSNAELEQILYRYGRKANMNKANMVELIIHLQSESNSL